MKRTYLITALIIFLIGLTIFGYRYFSPSPSNQNTPTNETVTTITKPLDPSQIRENIKNPDTMTRCLVIGTSHQSEYFINKGNILVKTVNKQGNNLTSHLLKVESEVYSWNSQFPEGSSFMIPTANSLKENPELREYLKLIPNTYQFDEEGVKELAAQGYQASCEVLNLDSKLFEPPYITFKKLNLDSSNSPMPSTVPSSPLP